MLPQAPAAAGSSRINLTHQMSSSNAKKAVGALTSAAAAAAASCGGKGSGSAGGTGAGSSGGANGGRMFDVGSSGGYYTEKSPKLMLHEWCTQQKRPKPKYKAIAIDPERGGGFRCACCGVGADACSRPCAMATAIHPSVCGKRLQPSSEEYETYVSCCP